MKAVVMDLLRQYLKVEIQFQNGECYSGLRINSVLDAQGYRPFFRMHLLILSTLGSSFNSNAEWCCLPALNFLSFMLLYFSRTL